MARWLGKILAPQGGSPPAGFFAAPGGSATGAGTIGDPWDLQTALDGGYPGGNVIQPGDTVWLRAGTYTGRFTTDLDGSNGNPIIVRNYPGERSITDRAGAANDGFLVGGSYTWFWGLEFIDSDKDASNFESSTISCDSAGNGIKFINNIIHDGRGGLSLSSAALNAEVYGNLFYYNGTNSNEHSFYPQNDTGTKHALNNIMLRSGGWNFHGHAENGHENNWDIQGNLSFFSGALVGTRHQDYRIDSGSFASSGISFLGNYAYDLANMDGQTTIFDPSPVSNDITVNDNYLVGGMPLIVNDFSTVQVRRNTIIMRYTNFPWVRANNDAGGPDPNTWDWDDNTYISTLHDANAQLFEYKGTLYTFANWKAASGLDGTSTSQQNAGGVTPANKVVVLPNAYETGRGHIYCYNWDLSSSLNIDISSVVPNGWNYVVKDAQNFFGASIASGTYGGGTISIPQTSTTIATPLSFTGVSTQTHTAPEFNVFVITSEAP